MNKIDVIYKIAIKTGIDRQDVKLIVENLLQVIQDSMLEGKAIHFKGFGKFYNKKRAKKIARNLTDNTAIIIESHYVPILKISSNFINKIRANVKD